MNDQANLTMPARLVGRLHHLAAEPGAGPALDVEPAGVSVEQVGPLRWQLILDEDPYVRTIPDDVPARSVVELAFHSDDGVLFAVRWPTVQGGDVVRLDGAVAAEIGPV